MMDTKAIAACAGVGKITISRHYASKEELVAEAIERVRKEIVIPNTGDPQAITFAVKSSISA